ncbi:MAG: hypothetical protein KH380_02800 [Coprobacillus sp.]|nr:hypothetical protein [Coprobacillus sp.]
MRRLTRNVDIKAFFNTISSLCDVEAHTLDLRMISKKTATDFGGVF